MNCEKQVNIPTMNVRSFADLDDILIDAHGINDNNQGKTNNSSDDKDNNNDNSYDEDLFETESPGKEQLQAQRTFPSQNSLARSPGADYTDDCFEADEPTRGLDEERAEMLYGVAYEEALFDNVAGVGDEPDVESKQSEREEEQLNSGGGEGREGRGGGGWEEGCENREGGEIDRNRTTKDTVTPWGLSIADPTYPTYPTDPTDVMTAALSLKKSIQPRTLSHKVMAGKCLGNKCQFSSVQQVSADDAVSLKQQREKRSKEKEDKEGKEMETMGKVSGNDSKGSNDSNDSYEGQKREGRRRDIVRSLEEMLLIAAERVGERSAAVSHVAARAVRVPTATCGISRVRVRQIMDGSAGKCERTV